ncbi:hypothetical protein ACFSUI_24950 [Ralstonia solanacearum]
MQRIVAQTGLHQPPRRIAQGQQPRKGDRRSGGQHMLQPPERKQDRQDRRAVRRGDREQGKAIGTASSMPMTTSTPWWDTIALRAFSRIGALYFIASIDGFGWSGLR